MKKLIPKKNICFITETGKKDEKISDASVRYRCYHIAETLLLDGHFCSIYSSEQFFSNPNLDFDVYIFHRPTTKRSGFNRLIKSLKNLNKILIADYDDLIFGDYQIYTKCAAVRNKNLSEESAEIVFRSNLEALSEFTNVTTSTKMLSEYAKKYNSNANVSTVNNFIPQSLISTYSNSILNIKKPKNDVIGYFSGSASHNFDLEMIADVLDRVLIENPNYGFMVVGPVQLSPKIKHLRNVKTLPLVPYQKLPSLMMLCSKIIAPLENNEFNQCKSRVKFLESMLANCDLISSPIQDMSDIKSKHLKLAKNKDEWYELLCRRSEYKPEQLFNKRNYQMLESMINLKSLNLILDAV